MMDVETIRPGLWRWTAPHPDWTEKEGGPGGWERDVASFYYEAPGHVVLLDPQAPPDGTPDAERFWRALDGDVQRLQLPVAVLLTYGLPRAQRRRRLRALPHPPGGQRVGAPGQPE